MDSMSGAPPSAALSRERAIEIAGYVGAAVCLTASGIALSRSAGTGVQIVVDLITAAVLFGAGWGLADDLDAYRRMRSVFWFLSVFSVADFGSTLFGRAFGVSDAKTVGTLTALLAGAYALVLWWRLRRSLQAIAFLGSAYAVVLILVFPNPGVLLFGPPDFSVFAVFTWILGLVTVVAGLLGGFTPRKTTVAVGSAAAILGPLLFLVNGHDVLGEVLSLATAVALVLAGDIWQERVAAGLGIAGTLVVSSTLVSTNVHSQGPAIAVLVVGLVLLGGTILAARSAGPASPSMTADQGFSPPPQPPPPLPEP
jgi:hypothetical protein